MPEQGPIQSTSHIVKPSSLEPPVKDESSKTPVRKQTATGYRTRHNSPTLEQRGIETAEATSNVNQKKTQIASIEKQYISHCDRKAKLEEKKEVAQHLETIRRFITSPGDFDEECGFEIKFVSESGKEETLLPPEKGLNPQRLKELLAKLGAQVDKFDEAFVKNGQDQILNQAIENEAEQAQEARSKLEQEAPESKALNYQPGKSRQYEFTIDLPDWPPAKAKEGFVINVNTPGSNPTTEQPRVILKPAPPSLAKEPEPAPESNSLEPNSLEPNSLEPNSLEPNSLEPNSLEPKSLELPGIENIRWLSPDAPLFLPNDYPQQEATATFINGSSDFALPEAAASKFEDSDVVRFQALHSTLIDQIKDGSSGMIPDDILYNEKITPTCIRQCFCDNTGSMGTTFVHVFAGNHSPSPQSQGNRNNQVMVLWFPKEGLKAKQEVAQQASLEVMEALNKYQQEAFWYNERPEDEEPSLAKDRLDYARLKKSAETEPTTIGPRNKKIRIIDPEAPVALPIVRAARFCSLPHDALLASPNNEMDNRALQGFRTALTASQGKSKESFQGIKFLKTLELPERLSPPEENPQPDKTAPVTPFSPGIPKAEPSPQKKDKDEFEAELDAALKKDLIVFDEAYLKETEQPELQPLTKTEILEEATTQAEKAFDNYINNNQKLTLFSEESAKAILTANSSASQQTSQHYVVNQPPQNTGAISFIVIEKEDKVSMSCYAEGTGSGQNSDYAKEIFTDLVINIQSLLNKYLESHQSLKGITDADIMNFIHHACLMRIGDSLKGASFSIVLNINNANWLINCGDIKTLHITHKDPEIRELQADNTDPVIAEHLAKVIFGKDKINPEQLNAAKNLPTVTKLPTGEEGAYYLLQTGAALSQLKPDIKQVVQKIVKGKNTSQEKVIKEEIKAMLLEKQGDQSGNTVPNVLAFFPPAKRNVK